MVKLGGRGDIVSNGLPGEREMEIGNDQRFYLSSVSVRRD